MFVELGGFDPPSLDFQSNAFTRLALVPNVFLHGFEPQLIPSKGTVLPIRRKENFSV